MKNLQIILIAVLTLTGFATVSYSIPNVWGEWTWEHIAPVHLMVSPSGQGPALTNAKYYGGAATDATIRIQLWLQGDTLPNPPPPAPVANFPGEDIWLEIPGLNACGGIANADGPTDSEGWFTFSMPLAMGGYNDPSGAPPLVYVMITGNTLYDQNNQIISPTIVLNSPDMNGDLTVNLTDVSLFTSDFYGSYVFRSDFTGDEEVNLSDVAILATFLGDVCP